MTRRFTKRNKGGVKTTSTLLTGVKKMQALHRAAKTNKRLRNQHDFEGSLNKMATWLIAVSKCPPRHYGKVWVEEKEQIIRQCERMYLEMQSHLPKDAFMGHLRDKRGGTGDSRYIPLSRLKWNVASAKWDFTNKPMIGKDPYWNSDVKPGKVRIISDQNEKSWALNHLSQGLMVPEEDTRRAYTQKVTQTYAEWRLASGLI